MKSLLQKLLGRGALVWRESTPSMHFLVAFSIAMALHVIAPLSLFFIDTTLLRFIGIVLLLVALILNTLALTAFKAHATPHAPFATPTALITTKIFAYSRNPVYLALVIVEVGFGFIVDSGWFFVMALMLFVSLNRYIIPNEERILQESFAEAYAEYKQRVGRWVSL